MTTDSIKTAVLIALLVAVAGIAGSMIVATQSTPTTGVTLDASPTDINDADSTHTVVFTVGSTAVSDGAKFNRILVDYSVATPSADVSNVNAGTIERIGVDSNGNDIGTRIDDTATISSVTGKSDGKAVLVETSGDLTLQAGDEVVVVLRPVQNPQNGGTPSVNVTLNGQTSGGDTASGTVEYVDNNANVTFNDQQTTGDSVTVKTVNLSEGGWVAISNSSGADPGKIRGATYLEPGNHTDVTVTLDDPLEANDTLYAQAHLDTNGDQRFDFNSSGGSVDELYRDSNGNVQTDGSEGGEAQVTKTTATPTPTATPTDTQTATPTDTQTDGTATPTDTQTDGTATPTDTQTDGTATPTPTDSSSDESSTGDGDPVISNFDATADGGTITVTFDSDEKLVDIEVDVRGAEDGTMRTEDFDGSPTEGYTGTYQASADGDYTLELVEAQDSSSDDGADDEEYTDSATVSGTSDGSGDDTTGDTTATPTEDGTTDDDTQETETGDEGTGDDGTGDDGTGDDGTGDEGAGDDTPTPTDADTGEDASGDESTDEGSDGDASGDEDDDDGTATEDQPGFGAVVALIALIASALLMYRRR